MAENPIQQLHRERLGLRIGSEMANYVERKLNDPSAASVAVMGDDARTGVPVRRVFKPQELAALLGIRGDRQL